MEKLAMMERISLLMIPEKDASVLIISIFVIVLGIYVSKWHDGLVKKVKSFLVKA